MNVLVLIHSPFMMWNIPRSHVERLTSDFPQHRFLHAVNDTEGTSLISDAEVAFSAQIVREQLAAGQRLRWIHSPAAGVGGMLYPEMIQRSVIITNSRGLAADTMAEHAIAMTLALFRRLDLAVKRQIERRWAQDEIATNRPNRMVAGSRVLVVGLGAIGSAVATRFVALGAHVAGIRKHPDAGAPPQVEVAGPQSLHQLLPTADIVVVSAPQTTATRHVIGAAELSIMKTTALLVNMSRGALVDEAALIQALRSRRIGGAALDVFEHEPLSTENELWNMPNVLITPHTAGFRQDHWDAATTLFADNLRRFENGEPLLNVVDKKAGY